MHKQEGGVDLVMVAVQAHSSARAMYDTRLDQRPRPFLEFRFSSLNVIQFTA